MADANESLLDAKHPERIEARAMLVRGWIAWGRARFRSGLRRLGGWRDTAVPRRSTPTFYPCGCSHRKVELGMCDQYQPGEVP